MPPDGLKAGRPPHPVFAPSSLLAVLLRRYREWPHQDPIEQGIRITLFATGSYGRADGSMRFVAAVLVRAWSAPTCRTEYSAWNRSPVRRVPPRGGNGGSRAFLGDPEKLPLVV